MSKKLGVALIIFSFAPWIVILGMPWLPVSSEIKASIITVCIALGELFFWGGTILVGKDIVQKYKNYFNPLNWFKKK